MFRLFLLISLFLNVFSVSVYAQTPVVNTSGSIKKLVGFQDSIQYILGAHIGQFIVNNGFSVTNPTLFKKGMDDAMLGKELLVNKDSVQALIKKYQSLNAVEQGKKTEKALFDALKTQPGIGVLPSGVCYTILKAGTGKRPQLNDSIQLHLKGFLPNNTLFEDTYPKNTPYKTSPSGVIAGMQEVLQIMPVGSLWRIYIPSALAFGAKGVDGLIPPYSALVYEVELLTVFDSPQK
ncbi:MAG: FKBP-type peptidyl-prolyl cis-trans isomerase [Bacteroidia bacterium]